MGVAESWDRVEAWLAAKARPVAKSLRGPAKAGLLEKFEARLGRTLPADFVASVARHDGQKESAESGLFPISDPQLGPLPAFRLLSLAEIAREWAMMKGLVDGGEFADSRSEPERGVRDDWWNVGWIPIAGDGGGSFFCLDLDPAEGGTPGQVIVAFNDMKARPRVADSFAAWLETLAEGFEAGRYVFDEDEGIVEPLEDDEDED